jgi:hypothetical protein
MGAFNLPFIKLGSEWNSIKKRKGARCKKNLINRLQKSAEGWHWNSNDSQKCFVASLTPSIKELSKNSKTIY